MKKQNHRIYVFVFIYTLLIGFSTLFDLNQRVVNNYMDYTSSIEVYLEQEELSELIEYSTNENIDIYFKAFIDNRISFFVPTTKSSCNTINHFSLFQDFVECSYDSFDSGTVELIFNASHINNFQEVSNYLTTKEIIYEDYRVSNVESSNYYIYFQIIITVLFSIVLYLLQIDYTKERAICKINGMSNQQLLKKGSFKIIVPFTICYMLIFTVMTLFLKVVYSKLTFDLWMKMLLKTYSILYLVVLLLVLVIVWTSVNFSVKDALKKHTKVYEKVVFGYIFKFILLFSTIFLLTFSTLRIIEIKTDITNVNEYEKFDGYVGYQISNETDKINFIQNYDKEAVYFSSVVYSIDKDKEVYDKYCSNRFKDIMFCKSFLGSGKFFEIATGKDFEENTIVIPKVYQNNTEEILSDVSKLYPDFEYNVEYLDDTVIYSYMYDYHNKSKDFIKDAVWIIVINPSTELLNINTVYTKKQFDSGAYYKIESFKYDYMKYIELTRNVVSVLIITSIFIMIFYTLINYYIIKININNKIKKVAIQALNGQSIYDIFYINYSIIIVNAIIAGGFVVYLEKDSTYYIPIVFTILLVILDFITNRIIINKLMRKSIVGFLKDQLYIVNSKSEIK